MIPTQNINFTIYGSQSQELIGVAEGTLPNFEAMTETISGAGLAGEIDVPVLGHFGSMTVELNWRTMTEAAAELNQQKSHQLDMRASIEVYDEKTGNIRTVPMKVVVISVPKSLNLGNLNVGAGSDSSSELEVVYIKIWYDGKEVIELDKFNYIYRVNGVDYLESVRRDLGKV
ncbi:MAG: phage major tail tube protein [Synergistaceae bacterium]|jgi:P2 family phage contractile tail tube protein|nr:phage major tail tube protein [Synergistaceae bacterium]